MGLSLGFCCCDTAVPAMWRMTLPSTFLSGLQSYEYTVGTSSSHNATVNGFTFLDGLVTLSRVSGNNWSLAYKRRQFGKTVVNFTHDFSTGLPVDVLVDITSTTRVGHKQIITLMLESFSRPADFWATPNRVLPGNVFTHNSWYGSTSNGLQQSYPPTNTTLSDSGVHKIWSPVSAGQPSVRLLKNRVPTPASGGPVAGFQVSYFSSWSTGGGLEEMPLSATVIDELGGFGGFAEYGVAWDENDPPLMEQFDITVGLMSQRYTLLGTGSSINGNPPTPSIHFERSSPPWLYDVDIPPGWSGPILSQRLSIYVRYGAVYVAGAFRLTVGPTNDFVFAGQFPLPTNGSGVAHMPVNYISGGVQGFVSIPFSVTRNNKPSGVWPCDDEHLAPILTPKIWMPEWYEQNQIAELPINWSMKKDEPASLYGRPFFRNSDSIVTIASGRVPTGMNWSVNSSFLDVTGTPTVNESGYIRFRIECVDPVTAGYTQPASQFYFSKTYFWKVGSGSAVIVYPTPKTNSGIEPTPPVDWRIYGKKLINTAMVISPTIIGTAPYSISWLGPGSVAPPHSSINSSTGVVTIGTTATPSTVDQSGTFTVTLNDAAGFSADVDVNWEYIWSQAFAIIYPDLFTNSGEPPTAGREWRIQYNTPATIPVRIDGAPTLPIVFSVASGSLPPGFTLDTNGDLVTTGIWALTTTGSVSIQGIDDEGEVVVSAVYDWEFVGPPASLLNLTYTHPYSNTAAAVPPGFDWRIDNTFDVSIFPTVTGAAPGSLTFTAVPGTLPDGCALNPSTGEVSRNIALFADDNNGTALITVTDSLGRSDSASCQWMTVGTGAPDP